MSHLTENHRLLKVLLSRLACCPLMSSQTMERDGYFLRRLNLDGGRANDWKELMLHDLQTE